MYSLVGIDGNVFNIMGYVTEAMRRSGFNKSEIDGYLKECTSSDCYSRVVVISIDYLNKCNKKIKGSGRKSL